MKNTKETKNPTVRNNGILIDAFDRAFQKLQEAQKKKMEQTKKQNTKKESNKYNIWSFLGAVLGVLIMQFFSHKYLSKKDGIEWIEKSYPQGEKLYGLLSFLESNIYYPFLKGIVYRRCV